MRRVHELEIWSRPGVLLRMDFGKDLAEELWREGVPCDVVLGLNSIPDIADVENLKTSIAEGELSLVDFVQFCQRNGMAPDLSSIESASSFLEYSFGRRLAWLHLPIENEEELLGMLYPRIMRRELVIVDPATLACLCRPGLQ